MSFSRTDEHFLRMSHAEGRKSTLQKTKRGAVIAKGNKVLGIGISARLEEGKSGALQISAEERYIATIRAEIAALGACIRAGINLTGATVYTSDQPDWQSFKTLVTLGIKRIVFAGPLTSKRISHYSQLLGVELLAVG
jgi:deoxycytidylate deaminase